MRISASVATKCATPPMANHKKMNTSPAFRPRLAHCRVTTGAMGGLVMQALYYAWRLTGPESSDMDEQTISAYNGASKMR